MNIFKRYLALVATLALITSLPLGAMKQPDQQKIKNHPIKEKTFYKGMQKDPITTTTSKEYFNIFVSCLKNISERLNKTYDQEEKIVNQKNHKECPLHAILKKHSIPYKTFEKQLKYTFSDIAINRFDTWCKTTEDSQKNNILFEKIIAYTKQNRYKGSFLIYNELKNFCKKKNIMYASVKNFKEIKSFSKDPSFTIDEWNEHLEILKHFGKTTIDLDEVPTFKKVLTNVLQTYSIDISSVCIQNEIDTSTSPEGKININYNNILLFGLSDEEIESIVYHECEHIKNTDLDITEILKDFFTQKTQEKISTTNHNNLCNFVQSTIKTLTYFEQKTRELYADNNAFVQNPLALITSKAKYFLVYLDLFPGKDPLALWKKWGYLVSQPEHLPLKKRILFWTQQIEDKLLNAIKNSQLQSFYHVSGIIPTAQEHLLFAKSTILFVLKNAIKNNNLQYIKEIYQTPMLTLKDPNTIFMKKIFTDAHANIPQEEPTKK